MSKLLSFHFMQITFMPKRCTGSMILNAKYVPVLICVVFDQNTLLLFH